MCQIDEDVLQALPDDIRAEIEESLSVKRRLKLQQASDVTSADRLDSVKRRSVSDVCIDTDDPVQPGCSHWTTSGAASASRFTASAITLPAYSQVLGLTVVNDKVKFAKTFVAHALY